MLLIKECELFRAWNPFSQQKKSPAYPKKSLDELIESGAFKPLDLAALTSGSSSTRYNIREKRSLAVRLGHSLMDFFDVDMGSKRIHLLGAATSSLRHRPLYVSFTSGLPGEIEAYTFRVGNPALLSFAKLLLEIHVGQSIPLSVGAQCDVANRATWAELCYYVDQLVQERYDTYLEAVRACLMVHIQISEALRLDDTDRVSDQLTIRKELYRQVVSKLERGLAESTPRAQGKRGRSESPEPPLKRICNANPELSEDGPRTDVYYSRHNTAARQFEAGPFSGGRVSQASLRRHNLPREDSQGMAEAQRGLSHMALIHGFSGFFDEPTPDVYPPNL